MQAVTHRGRQLQAGPVTMEAAFEDGDDDAEVVEGQEEVDVVGVLDAG